MIVTIPDFVQYRHHGSHATSNGVNGPPLPQPPAAPRTAADRKSELVTFRNDLVPNKFEPYVSSRRTSNCYSDYVPWTDTEDEVQRHAARCAMFGFRGHFSLHYLTFS